MDIRRSMEKRGLVLPLKYKTAIGWIIYTVAPTLPLPVEVQVGIQALGAVLAAIGLIDKSNKEEILTEEMAETQQKVNEVEPMLARYEASTHKTTRLDRADI